MIILTANANVAFAFPAGMVRDLQTHGRPEEVLILIQNSVNLSAYMGAFHKGKLPKLPLVAPFTSMD